jgi:[acyl-carrier-protein] S-malonyltransferase
MTASMSAVVPFVQLRDEVQADCAFIFPGQGSQIVGMGKDLYESSRAAREVYDAADEVLGFKLSRLCFEGPESDLMRTENTQPAIAVTSVAMLRCAIEASADGLPRPAYVAGHSLGEYSALIAAGAIGFADALRLLRLRGELMQAAAVSHPGTMAAIMGMDPALCAAACAEAGAEICTDNAPGQIVIGGPFEAVRRAMADCTERGAVRVVELSVSGAFHTSLMREAAAGLQQPIAAANFVRPLIAVIGNCSATPILDPSMIRSELVEQVCQTVKWRGTMELLLAEGVTTFVELGPGKVLSSIVKRMQPAARTITVNCAAAVAFQL